MIQFHHALDATGNIININEITQENRAKCYYCIGCGAEMSAVLGEKRQHHFRHKEAHCSWESYLHKFGKKKLKEKFDTQKEFIISYYVEFTCEKAADCQLTKLIQSPVNSLRQLPQPPKYIFLKLSLFS